MSRLMVMGMGIAFAMLLFAAPASAQVKCDPKITEAASRFDCSPGYWKNHVEVRCPVTGAHGR